MATYCISIHDLRRLLRQKEHNADYWPLHGDSHQSGHDSREERHAADSCSLDADSDQIDLDDNEETEPIELNRQNEAEESKCCLRTQTRRRRQQRIDSPSEREYRSREEGS
jgi:hypothetical protein